MSDRFERTVSILLVGAAIAIAAVVVRREFLVTPAAARSAGIAPARYESDWRAALASAEPMGDSASPIKIVEFSDLECPFCRTFHKDLEELIAENPRTVAGFFVHFPNRGHRFAFPAARAAECARSAGRFSQFVGVVFEKQDSLGIKSWGSYALEAGIPDTGAIRICAGSAFDDERISEGVALGHKRLVAGTPTVLINGWRIEGSPGKPELKRIIGDLQSGKRPFPDSVPRS
jgi:protein-disulfide isomerase